MMASPSSSSSSSKHNQPVWAIPRTWNTKKFTTINDYINSYFAANLLRPQLNKPPPKFSQQASDSDTPSHSRSENRHRFRTKNKTEAEKINELAKEMDKMLSKAKSKRQTNDLLQLFKNTLNNFIVPEHPMDGNTTYDKPNSNLKYEKQISLPTAQIYPQYHHHHQHKLEEINENQPSEANLFSDHETSMTMCETTTTRCEIKDPSRSMIESSKTNILHRCYGKQSVKALPQIYKNRKKNNSNVINNCQRPPVIKTKSQKSPKQLQARPPNKQMKTIYENDQYDKSKKLIAENSDDTDGLVIDNSTSISSVDTDKQSIIETQVNNEIVNTGKYKKISKDCTISKTTDIRKQTSKSKITVVKNEQETNNTINKDNKQTVIDISVEQDNSIVQRLTSFWNKKLNVLEQTKSMTDQSSITSSLTSIFDEEDGHKNNNQNENFKLTPELKLEENVEEYIEKNRMAETDNDRGDIELIDNKNKLKENTSTNKVNKELIRNKNRTSHHQDDKDLPDLKMGLMDELLRVLQNRDGAVRKSKKRNNDEKEKKIKLNSELTSNCLTTKDSQNSVTMNETGDESSDYEEDNYDIEQCDEQTIEAIEKCLLDNIMNEGMNHDVEDCFNEQRKIISEECLLENMTSRKHINTDDEHKESKISNAIHDNENKYESGITNFNDHSAVITNVNSIIINLKNLIHTIESIPDELKSVDMNLSSLPIPDKIKHKISSLIITSDNESNIENGLSIIQTTNALNNNQLRMLVTPVDRNQLFRCCSSGKLIGYTKREGYICTLYFPKMLTLPVIENVKNPFQKILFPKRNECLKLVKNKSLNHINKNDNISTIKTSDISSNDGDEHKEEINKRKKIIIEDLQSKSEIIKQNSERVDKRIMEITKLETRTTQSSIFFITSPPSTTITALKSLNKSNDNIHAGPRKTILFKPSKITTTVFPSETLPQNLNNKSRVKFEENICIESNSIGNKNSSEELSDRTSDVSCAVSNTNQQEEFNIFTVHNINNRVENNNDCFQEENDTFRKESRVNLDDGRPASPTDLNMLNRRYNNMRRRRCRLQTHIDDDNAILAGGSGDSMHNCGDGSPPIPCHHTSSMSVVVSNSINDSNSQPDITLVESESNLSRLRLNGHCSMITRSQVTQDSDNFSTCGVIQEEGDDEQLSDIDDCVMIEEHNINKKENKKNSIDTVSSSTISSQNMNLSINHEQDVTAVISQDHEEECNDNDKRQTNEHCSNDQFSYQNLKNMLNEEVTLLSRNCHEEDITSSNDHNVECKANDERQLNENCCEKEFSYHNLNMIKIETITEENNDVLSQPEINQTSSFESENICPTNNYSNTSLSQRNVNDFNDINNSDDNNSSNNDSYDQDDDDNNTDYGSINKNDFHRNYHAVYFETEISKDAQFAIANKLVMNDLKILFENDPFLKVELSKIFDIDNLSDKEKQLIAACINFMNRNYYDKHPPPLFNISTNDLSLKLCLNTLWNKTSQTMSSHIKLARKSIIPYKSDTLLYRRCYRKLKKALYTLFVSLLLVFIIQKHFFGILLPVCFPW